MKLTQTFKLGLFSCYFDFIRHKWMGIIGDNP